jgi:hypothetical protein
MATEALLPEQFADLEKYAEVWALPTGPDRYRRRLAGTMDEIQQFYDAVMPRGEEALTYLEKFEDLDDMPDNARHLMWMMASLSVVSFAVDVFKQPQIPDTNAASLDWVSEPAM